MSDPFSKFDDATQFSYGTASALYDDDVKEFDMGITPLEADANLSDDDLANLAFGTGACTLSNSPADLGQAMIDERIKGTSWADIADKFGLPSPSAARSKFTKLTGITDYKIKGKELQKLWDQNLLDGLKAPKVKAKKLKKAMDNVDAALNQSSTIQFELNEAKGASQKLAANMIESYENIHGAAAVDKVRELFVNGTQGYLKLSQTTGIPIADIDGIIWNHLLLHPTIQGDIWKAYALKPGSETGFKVVQRKIVELKSKGFDPITIEQLTNLPVSVTNMVGKGTWKMPPAGTNTPVLKESAGYGASAHVPKVHVQPQVIYSTPTAQGTNFAYKSESEWVKWHNDLGTNLTGPQLSAVKNYTGSGYHSMNMQLRAGKASSGVKHADQLSSAMQPIPFDTKVTRWTGSMGDAFDPMTAGGTVWGDNAFLSTAITPAGTFSGRQYKLIIDIPKGTPGRYVDTMSTHRGEKELILDKDVKYMVTHVEKTGGYWEIRMTALP